MMPLLQRDIRKLIYAILLFIISMVIGTTGYMTLEAFNFVDAAYMAILAFSTVGFNEVKPLSQDGKLFSLIYIIVNLGIFAYIVSVLSAFLFEGELRKIFKNIASTREMKKLNHHIIVCGYGKNGAMACKELYAAGKSFIVIEKDPAVMEAIPDGQKFPYLIGSATMDEVLLEAGIERASTIISALKEDSDNVFITLTAKELNPDIHIIAKATNINSEKKLYRAGAAHVVMPDYLGGVHMAHLVTKPFVIEFLDLISGVGGSKLELEEVSYENLKPEFRDKTIRDLDIRNKSGATIIAFKDDVKGFMFNPHSSKVVSHGDILILLGDAQAMKKFKGSYVR